MKYNIVRNRDMMIGKMIIIAVIIQTVSTVSPVLIEVVAGTNKLIVIYSEPKAFDASHKTDCQSNNCIYCNAFF